MPEGRHSTSAMTFWGCLKTASVIKSRHGSVTRIEAGRTPEEYRIKRHNNLAMMVLLILMIAHTQEWRFAFNDRSGYASSSHHFAVCEYKSAGYQPSLCPILLVLLPHCLKPFLPLILLVFLPQNLLVFLPHLLLAFLPRVLLVFPPQIFHVLLLQTRFIFLICSRYLFV